MFGQGDRIQPLPVSFVDTYRRPDQTIGKYCIIGGTSVFNGHISICDGVTISGMCMVMRSIDKPGIYSSGIPAQTNKEWRITAARTLHINEMYHRLSSLEEQVESLTKQLKQ